MEKLFDSDVMGKRERVLATLNYQPVDRVALLEQLTWNPRVIADWTGKKINGFDYTRDDVCAVCRLTMDMVMPPSAPCGTDRVTTPDGWVHQYDNWTSWTVERPFKDEKGAKEWLLKRMQDMREGQWNAGEERRKFHDYMADLQQRLGETVILAYPILGTGLCSMYGDHGMGLEIFTYFFDAYPDVFREYMDLSMAGSIRKTQVIADEYRKFSPVVLIAEDFSTKQGPIFPPEFLDEFHYPNIKRLAEIWHEHGVKALYHSDGNYRKAIPDLMACGVDGFYCLEPNCGMDIVEFKNTWPEMVWAGGVDGVDLLERGTPAQVKAEVRRHIMATNALKTGGMFVASSSEINPPIPPGNFRAMVEAVGEARNTEFQ